MKLKEYSREQAKNFVISWTIIFSLFGLMVGWSFIAGFQIQTQSPGEPVSILWPHTFLLFLVLFSLLLGIVSMWKRYLSGQYDKVRNARNISFIVVLFLYPLGVIMNLILINTQ